MISIFCHLPPPLRADLHRRCVAGLRAGGLLLLESLFPSTQQLSPLAGGEGCAISQQFCDCPC